MYPIPPKSTPARPARALATALLAGALLLAGAAAQPGPASPHGAHVAPAAPGDAGDAAALEIAFMSDMIAHHRGAVAMAEWLLARAPSPELRQAAEAILAAQEPEIQRMTEWLRAWYEREPEPAAAMQREMDAMLAALAEADDPERAFLEAMIAHHMGAIDMAQLALANAAHAELRALARDVIVSQTEEVFAYREWLAGR